MQFAVYNLDTLVTLIGMASSPPFSGACTTNKPLPEITELCASRHQPVGVFFSFCPTLVPQVAIPKLFDELIQVMLALSLPRR